MQWIYQAIIEPTKYCTTASDKCDDAVQERDTNQTYIAKDPVMHKDLQAAERIYQGLVSGELMCVLPQT